VTPPASTEKRPPQRRGKHAPPKVPAQAVSGYLFRRTHSLAQTRRAQFVILAVIPGPHPFSMPRSPLARMYVLVVGPVDTLKDSTRDCRSHLRAERKACREHQPPHAWRHRGQRVRTYGDEVRRGLDAFDISSPLNRVRDPCPIGKSYLRVAKMQPQQNGRCPSSFLKNFRAEK
jgi:hypothetical protein